MSTTDLIRNAVHVLPQGALEQKLQLGRPLRVKLGIDVTAPDVTLGNGIPLQRMRAFQDAGHVGVLIVGDYTTRIGDPSGRSRERPIIDPEEIDRNAARYFEHASTIIDPDRTELRMNSEWLSKLDFAETLRLTRTATVARLLERDDFSKTVRAERADIGLRAALPAHAGVRLGRGAGGRRARRHGSALQPPHGARRHGGVRPRAAGRADRGATSTAGTEPG